MRNPLWCGVRRRSRNERRVVRGIDEAPADRDDHEHDAHLHDDDQRIDERRFLRPANEQRGQGEKNHDRRNIDNPAHVGAGPVQDFNRRVRPLVGDTHAEPLEHAVEVFAPRDRDRRRAHRVLEDEVPPDNPRDELAHRRVGIGIGASGDRNHRCELGVAESGERASDACDDERERHRRARAIRDRRRGSNEQARADDGADAERDQRHRAERALERPLAARLGVRAQ